MSGNTSQIQEKIENEIIGLIIGNQQCSFGFIVKELNFSYNEIFKSVLKLKKQGIIMKSREHQGNYIIAE